MNKIKKLFAICEDSNWHVSLTYQRINDYSVEIYTGYVSSYENLFFSDGHASIDGAIQKGLDWCNGKIKVHNKCKTMGKYCNKKCVLCDKILFR